MESELPTAACMSIRKLMKEEITHADNINFMPRLFTISSLEYLIERALHLTLYLIPASLANPSK